MRPLHLCFLLRNNIDRQSELWVSYSITEQNEQELQLFIFVSDLGMYKGIWKN